MRWPTPSPAATWPTSRTSWATCCSRSSSTPAWRKEARRLRFRRRGRDHHRQADPPPPACLCRRTGPHRASRQRPVGAHQGGGKSRTRRGCGGGRARRRSARPARVNPRLEAAGQGRPRRLRLERSARRSRQDPRGSRRDRSRARCRRQGAGGERSRRSAVRGGQPGAPHGAPTRKACCARPTSNSSAALPRSRPRSPRGENGRRTRLWPRWTRCGMRRKRRRKRANSRLAVATCSASMPAQSGASSRDSGPRLRGTSGIFARPCPYRFNCQTARALPRFFGQRRVRRRLFLPLPENRGRAGRQGS